MFLYFFQIDNNLGQTKPFTFNQVFSHNASQEKVSFINVLYNKVYNVDSKIKVYVFSQVFEECGIKHLIDMALEGLVL